MNISPCNPYHAIIEDCRNLQLADGKSIFKVYFVSIVDRPTPEKFQWNLNSLTKDQAMDWLRSLDLEGIGFITAFPHITKIFRISPQNETLVNVAAFNTQTGQPLSLERPEGYTEFACLAEAVIATEEFKAWAEAQNVADYLAFTSTAKDEPVRSNHKLADYFN